MGEQCTIDVLRDHVPDFLRHFQYYGYPGYCCTVSGTSYDDGCFPNDGDMGLWTLRALSSKSQLQVRRKLERLQLHAVGWLRCSRPWSIDLRWGFEAPNFHLPDIAAS